VSLRGSENRVAVVGPSIGVVVGSVPPAMECEVYGIGYANPSAGTVTAVLFERRMGTVVGYVHAAVLPPASNYSIGFQEKVVARIHSECELCGSATGTIYVSVQYRYVTGRSRIP